MNPYQTATQIDNIEPLLTKDDAHKITLMEQLVQKYVDVRALLGDSRKRQNAS
jgi:BioD-like phosphotransacetylase family protein